MAVSDTAVCPVCGSTGIPIVYGLPDAKLAVPPSR